MEHCHSGSCSHGKEHSHDHECHCECHKEHKGSYAEQLLKLADEAWMEVIKEKIKEEIRQHNGEHIDQLAKLVSEMNHKRWTDKIGEMRVEHDFELRLKDLIYYQHKK